MNILYINHTILKSGAAISLGTLIKNLRPELNPCYLLRTGSQVDEILGVTGSSPRYYARFLSQYLTTMYGGNLTFLQFWWQIVKTPLAMSRAAWLAHRWNCQLVHVNETKLPADAAGAALAGFPVIIHARTAFHNRKFERGVLQWVSKLPTVRFVAIDEEVRSSMPPGCQAKCTIIHNPISLGPEASAEAISAKREAWEVRPQDVVVGQVASLHDQKGIWDVLDIASALCPNNPNLRFVLVGDTSPEAGRGPQLREAIANRGLNDKVILAGYDRELPAVYGALDISLCLFGAGLGGVGRTAYEACISGRPLVATLPGARNSQTLTHERHGLLYEPRDIRGVKEGIQQLAANPELRRSLGEMAKSEIGLRHQPENVAAMTLSVYREALGTAK